MKCNNDNDDRCKKDEVDRLLSFKKLQLDQPRTEKCLSLSEAEWDVHLMLAKVTKFSKNLTKNFTHSRNKSIYLYPEECLYLLEMKNLILKWNGNVLSIQNAYSLLLSAGSNCSFKQFRTYSYLVKLGFRVFKYDSKLNNNNYSSKDLTKLPEKSSRKTKSNNINKANNFKDTQLVNLSLRNNVNFPKITSSAWVMVSTPPKCYLPLNLQPKYDFYMFKITVSPVLTEITAMLSDYYSDGCIKKFFEKESIVYDSPITGMYPVYEKNISNTVQSSAVNTCEPRNKKLKLLQINEDSVPIAIHLMSPSLNDDSNNKDNFVTRKNSLPFNMNIMAASSSLNANLSNTEKKDLYNKQDKTKLSSTTTEDETFSMESCIPSHIKNKLFAIKPTEVSYTKNVNGEHCVRYDVYYPNNNFPKKIRSAPDYRVIVFEDNLNDFPNICDVNISNPHDNIPTLWAIVNSSSVSFYNVNNITLPKSTDWEIKV